MSIFVSGLGVNGLALGRRAGLEPLGIVYGVVNRVTPSGGVSVIGEQRRSMQAHLDALHAALAHMEQQARALGGDGVAGVTIELRSEATPGSEFTRLLECRAGGTAVRDAGAQTGAALWSATLSPQEIWALRQAGYEPKAVAVGFGAVFATGDRWAARRQLRGERTRTIGQNIELSWMAEALQRARSLALAGVETEAKQAGASGVVGLQIEKRLHRSGTGGLLVEIQATGTAVGPPGHATTTALATVANDMAEPGGGTSRTTARAARGSRGTM